MQSKQFFTGPDCSESPVTSSVDNVEDIRAANFIKLSVYLMQAPAAGK